MNRFFEPLDRLAGTIGETGVSRWLDRTAFVFLTLMVLTCPHSIAASETAWLIGLTATVLRLVLKPRREFKFRPLDIALWAFFGWSVVSAVLSYEPSTSLDRLRGVSLFLVFVFVAINVRKLRAVWFLAFALILSCTVNAVREPLERIIGRGVEIHGISPAGPLTKAGFADGDTLLKVNGVKLTDPAQLVTALETNEVVTVDMHRPDMYEPKDVRRSDLLAGTNASERLGFAEWQPSHYWRATGFYRHWITYSEALQLIVSLVFGLLFASFFYGKKEMDQTRPARAADADRSLFSILGRVVSSIPFLAFSLLGMGVALLLTATRASQLSFMISAFVIVAISASRRFLLASVVIVLPLALFGLLLLQQSRQVGFIDSKDESTLYRLTMWRDGMRLWTESPRNFVFGVGMDSKDKRWQEWHMYDNGWLPLGHFHSTPVQLLVERGLPALLIWIMILGIYARTIWRGLRANRNGDWRTVGILLGSFGGAIGFVTSGFVHSNIIDAVVALIFYLMMGLGVRTAELSGTDLRIESR